MNTYAVLLVLLLAQTPRTPLLQYIPLSCFTDPNPDVCRIAPKMLWIRIQDHFSFSTSLAIAELGILGNLLYSHRPIFRTLGERSESV